MGRKNAKGRRNAPQKRNSLSPNFTQNALVKYQSNDIDGDVIREMNIPDEFPQAVIDEVKQIVAREPDPKVLLSDPEREDLTQLPFVTIDGEDARDFDDAVYAYPDPDGGNKGGHILWVAIADVSHYVRPGSATDKEAKLRGTSVYLPGKVVPMLPEELSNGLCSLKPEEHRAVSAYKLKISGEGKVLDYKFTTGVIKSRARLTYTKVLDALEGRMDATTQPIFSSLIVPLHNVYKTLAGARVKRNAVDFGHNELSVHADPKGGKGPVFNLITGDDARALIEEAMIAANISAAREQENSCDAGVYRVQDVPEVKKLYTAKMLTKLGVKSAKKLKEGDTLSQKDFVHLLREADGSKDPNYARGLILRMQERATYSADNIGHFCLALAGYTHFTSPIRRYPDLMVHRNIKAVYNLAAGYALDEATAKTDLDLSADNERRNDAAGKEARKRYTMNYLVGKQGQELDAEIISVNDKGGVRLSIADCNYMTTLRMGELPAGSYQMNAARDTLINTTTGHEFTVGDKLKTSIHFNFKADEDLPTVLISNLQDLIKPRAGQQGQKPSP
ncbi:MAG: VacB/RNase II family 3'-5' exoribonuclease [Pseudomonadota bacterium]|nr:hypothetical protein [Alphaproteobacteria bacterium]MEE3323316.1 VacB/RNase II family 3'-5' exoribonuclease [Pseudomonadota bacterium]|tara:strand:+ start:245 stop:1927 length:1683 start_codon:yes stop_codon:yes gene_type:complete